MWTYDPSNLDKSTPEGRMNIVRFLIGDTDDCDPQLQDEELLFTLDASGGRVYSAAVTAVNALISKYSRLVNTELDEAIREDFSDLVENYVKLRKTLSNSGRLTNGSISIIATGITKTDFEKAWDDTERVRPGIEQFKWRDRPYGFSDYRYITASG